jgi:hypothetical protein
MRRIIIALVGLCGMGVLLPAGIYPRTHNWVSLFRSESPVTSIAQCPDNRDVMLCGVKRGIYVRRGKVDAWERVARIGGGRIYQIAYVDAPWGRDVYAACADGVYRSDSSAQRWTRVFRVTHADDRRCLSLDGKGGIVMVGTGSGLFRSRDNGATWERVRCGGGRERIQAIAVSGLHPGVWYAASDTKVFLTENSGDIWQEIFSASGYYPKKDSAGESGNEEGGAVFPDGAGRIYSLVVGKGSEEELYLYTGRGILYSADRGSTWVQAERFVEHGGTPCGLSALPDGSLAVFRGDGLHILRKTDAVRRDGQVPEQMKCGYETVSVATEALSGELHSVYAGEGGSVYVGTAHGIYAGYLAGSGSGNNVSRSHSGTTEEPHIRHVQCAAVEYAEVELEKIKDWRRKASQKPWLPALNVSVDRNVTDLWHWESGSTVKSGDDDLHRGKDAIEWGITMSWDLSDLIFSDDQTAIDVRSKLMVQLRDDIIDDVTKLYYERKRLLGEAGGSDRTGTGNKQLRLSEVTALLDAMTGHRFNAYKQ